MAGCGGSFHKPQAQQCSNYFVTPRTTTHRTTKHRTCVVRTTTELDEMLFHGNWHFLLAIVQEDAYIPVSWPAKPILLTYELAILRETKTDMPLHCGSN
jgi:hypothetical protein